MPTSPHWLTVEQAAETLQVPAREMQKWVKSEVVKHFRIGKLVRIHPQDLEEFARKHVREARGTRDQRSDVRGQNSEISAQAEGGALPVTGTSGARSSVIGYTALPTLGLDAPRQAGFVEIRLVARTVALLVVCGLCAWSAYIASQEPKLSLNAQQFGLVLLKGRYRSWFLSFSDGQSLDRRSVVFTKVDPEGRALAWRYGYRIWPRYSHLDMADWKNLTNQ